MKIKEFKTYEEQVSLLNGRGLIIGNHDKAVDTLRYVNYYRLSGYWYPFRQFDSKTGKPTDVFQEGATFEHVLDLYKFDEELRCVIFSELSTLMFSRNLLNDWHIVITSINF